MSKENKFEDDFKEEDEKKADLKLWNYKDEKEIIGVVKGFDEDGQFGKSVIVDTATEQDITIPSLTALNTKLKDVKIGQKIKIVNLGLVRGKNKRDYYDFQVFIK